MLICAIRIFYILGRHLIGLYFLRIVPSRYTFWIRVVFPSVIHSSIFLSFTLVIDECEFSKPEFMCTIMASGFPNLNDSMCISATKPSSNLCNSFSMLLIHCTFILCSLHSDIYLQIVTVWVPLHPVVGMFPCIRIFFRYFRKSCFDGNASPRLDIF